MRLKASGIWRWASLRLIGLANRRSMSRLRSCRASVCVDGAVLSAYRDVVGAERPCELEGPPRVNGLWEEPNRKVTGCEGDRVRRFLSA